MKRFKPGDRVILTDDGRGEAAFNDGLRIGSVGTVTTEPEDLFDENFVSVSWDDNLIALGGHAHDCGGHAEPEHGWRVNDFSIEFYNEAPVISGADLMEVLLYAN